jgi:hypothetical protein
LSSEPAFPELNAQDTQALGFGDMLTVESA